jgi:Mrp family chromosome partitioning ATPase
MNKVRSLIVGTHPPEQFALLTDYDPDSPYAVAYQTVYTNIRSHWESEHNKQLTISLTTPTPYKGQAAIAANIAIAAAQSGTPTILVDADLSAPSLRFTSEDSAGLSDLLSRETLTAQTVTPSLLKVFVPGLYVVCGGKALSQAQERSRLLATKLRDLLVALRDFLANIQSAPGIIILHSPPVLSGAEAALIGSLVDQTFLAIVSGLTTRTQALQALEQLQRANVQVAGTITLDA